MTTEKEPEEFHVSDDNKCLLLGPALAFTGHVQILVNCFLPGRQENIHFYIEITIPTTERETEGGGWQDLCLRFIKSSSDFTDIVRNVNYTDGVH